MWIKNAAEALAGGVEWAYKNPRFAVELALVAGLLFLGWRYNKTVDALAEAKAQHGELEEGLRQKISIINGQVEILRREKGKVVYKKVYVPPEGSVTISETDWAKLNADYQELQQQLESGDLTGEERRVLKAKLAALMAKLARKGTSTTVVVKNKGFTFRPGFGAEWAGVGLGPRLDIKWGFWNRYSALVGGGKDGVDVSVSRHVDDLLWGRPQNVEVFAGYKVFRMPDAGQFVLGFRSNF